MAREWFTVRACGDAVELLDQRRLPEEERYLTLRDVESVARAIEDLAVRGAPAIGCTAAYGVALAAHSAPGNDLAALCAAVDRACERLAATRPTAVNLFYALECMRTCCAEAAAAPAASLTTVRQALAARAEGLAAEDEASCRRIGEAGLPLVPEDARILTHCNAGALATAGSGTALGVVRAAFAAGRKPSVLACETRPFLQGARLTAWELARDGMAAHFMARGEVDLVIVGADRVAANGDVANKIGTYGLAVLARAHRLPFYVAAPASSFDLATPDGASIPIEERGRDEVAFVAGRAVLPEAVPVRHPAFDVTPAELVTAWVTDRGLLEPPFDPEPIR
jgi:methylthioribose-1-phosphate isomerase